MSKENAKNVLEDIYDTIMKNNYKVRDFTKYDNSYIDLDKKEIHIGKKYIISISETKPEKPKTTQEHFDECLRHWGRHGKRQ